MHRIIVAYNAQHMFNVCMTIKQVIYFVSTHVADLSFTSYRPPYAVTFSWWGIEYLNHPDSYADWNFYTPVTASQVRQVQG